MAEGKLKHIIIVSTNPNGERNNYKAMQKDVMMFSIVNNNINLIREREEKKFI